MSASAPRRSFQQIEILWPSGTQQVLKDVAVNQILVIEEPDEERHDACASASRC